MAAADDELLRVSAERHPRVALPSRFRKRRDIPLQASQMAAAGDELLRVSAERHPRVALPSRLRKRRGVPLEEL